ncbi:alpha-ketoglutarate-dependent dioxygenase AlkB [Caulobacter sp. S45]|uniref:alpha-ketoglutarate-dependent dioxygenase AlkB n=1 Tax=Caulobacter sp. S45 TaxID=1641861 RepID=UPI0020B14AD5|nr:alpha-ketoglutarate-dependent dioxygenase AlkB [Caulobacter sp. S45]
MPQPSLFEADPRLPLGFVHQPEVLSQAEADELVDKLADLNFEPFRFRGFVGRREVVSFGWRYDFDRGKLLEADQIPAFLEPARRIAASFAGLAPDALGQVLINRYAAGAGIGWHRDRPQFEDVVALSLGARGVLRFRRRRGSGWERVSVAVEPRSAYLLRGPSRTEWEHSLPEVDALRFSITFRTLRRPVV